MILPVAASRNSTVFASGDTLMHSQPVLTSIANMWRNMLSLATSRLDSSVITPPTW